MTTALFSRLTDYCLYVILFMVMGRHLCEHLGHQFRAWRSYFEILFHSYVCEGISINYFHFSFKFAGDYSYSCTIYYCKSSFVLLLVSKSSHCSECIYYFKLSFDNTFITCKYDFLCSLLSNRRT
ncbi:unnamed protein product [Chrysodeixis includens]|uniref:Uncharacterized protein n=1 Tax=Chrysodeixis includens TaxID=689277 RepID=A0A9N8KZ45_CHRIL|nr:unnamed protein product [Chrysodeixis includens]